MGYNNLWNPPTDLISKIYSSTAGSSKISLKKKLEKKKNKARLAKKREENRNFLQNFFGLHKYATNSAICHAVAIKLELPIPDQKNQYNKFIKKAANKLRYEQKQYKSGKSKFKTSEEFYSSPQWKDIRYIALKQSDGCCTLCGARASDGAQIHVDHIKPRSKYPKFELDLNNLQILCGDCNMGKSNIDDTNWRQHWESI